jgi:hypothetical protein
MVMMFAIVLPAFADTVPVNFEPPTYTTGSISGQDGWGNAINPSYDQGVVSNIFGYPSFGSQSFRISDAVTSGSFGDWVFVKPLTNSVGEADATSGTFSVGTKQPHFEMQFDIASTQSTEQPGLHVSVSPDRGDGSRMSYLRFDDKSDGIHVMFDDVTDPGPIGTVANFNETDIATIDRNPHTIKLTMDTLDGPGNDIVKVYIDGVLVHTGTSWEDYYRFDPEAASEQSPRIVKTMIIQARGTADPANEGKGFLFDNISLVSSPIPAVLVGPPTKIDQCKKGGWQTFNNPMFTNQGKCVSYVRTHASSILGNVKYTAYGLQRSAQFAVDSSDSGPGVFEYSDANHAWYKVLITSIKVNGHDGWFAGKVFQASNPSWVGQWLFVKVNDSSTKKIWGSFTSQAAAQAGVLGMTDPADGPFTSSGALVVH